MSATEPPSGPSAEQNAWLRANAAAVGSIDIDERDFSDFAPIARALDAARLVLLGEPSHGDGVSFRAKARLVRFLHEELGFDVLAWEAGMLDCEVMDRALASGAGAAEAAALGLFPIWSRSAEIQSLFGYAAGARAAGRPMSMAGIDCQSSALGADRQSDEVLARFQRVAPGQLSADDGQALRAGLRGLEAVASAAVAGPEAAAGRQAEPAAADLEPLLRRLKRQLDAAAPLPSVDAAHVQRLLDNLLLHALDVRDLLAAVTDEQAMRVLQEGNDRRDRAMADNLLWLAEQRYPGRKIVVWAANSHIARASFQVPGLQWRPMGEHLAARLGSAVYSLGFTAYQGTAGLCIGGDRWPVGPSSDGSLESALHGLRQEHAFLDLRAGRHQAGPGWLCGPIPGKPFGYAEVTACWPDLFDGLFFSDRMEPSAPLG